MHSLDAKDKLANYRARFVLNDEVRAYLDGNSLGRPLRASVERVRSFAEEQWGGRLIRGWEERWLDLNAQLGDELGSACLGAAPGQVIIGDSTTIFLYKLCRAAIARQRAIDSSRDEIVVDTDNFPTDRYVMEGIAVECGCKLRWIQADSNTGVSTEQVAAVLNDRTALLVFSHVSYRSAFIADVPAITEMAHAAGVLVCWDACHSVGSIPCEYDTWNVDLAVGCTYKYLCAGPGAPGFCYVASRLQSELEQPIQGWIGAQNIFAMGPTYIPARGMRKFLSNTPPVSGMVPLIDTIALYAEVGMPAVREKSIALTEYAVRLYDSWLAPLGVRLASPRDINIRGSHVTFAHPSFASLVPLLQAEGVIPDFRGPDNIRIGLSPLSTSFEEVEIGIRSIMDHLQRAQRRIAPEVRASL